MNYDIHLTIPEDSSGGHLISALAAKRQMTPNEVVELIINEAARKETPRPSYPAQPETPIELVARLRARKQARGAAAPRPPRAYIDLEQFFGMMSGDEDFGRAMDEIIAGRVERYGLEE